MIVENKGNAIKPVKRCNSIIFFSFSLLERNLDKLFLAECSMTLSFCCQVDQNLKLHDKLA